MAVTDYFERGLLIAPDGVCLEKGDRRYTYREVANIVYPIANRLMELGYGENRNAAVLCDNDPVGYAATLGIMRAAMRYVAMDFRNAAELNQRILEFSDSEILFYQSRFHEQIEAMRPKLPNLERTVCLDARIGETPSLEEWIGGASAEEPKLLVPRDAIAWLQTGSGTAGDFKMAMIAHRAYHTFVAFQKIWLPDPAPVMLVAAPITHAGGGLSYQILAMGGRLILIDKPDPESVLRAIEDKKITQVFLPPTAIYRLLDHPKVREFDYSSLKYMIYSAAPMSLDKLKLALDVFGPVMAEAYGQTEALGIACFSPEEHFIDGALAPDRRLSACGRPSLPFCKVAIMDDAGERLPKGETGEICVVGDQMMDGYYKNPMATRKTVVDGWLHTGDVGFFDEEGYLHIVDRKKDLIISGGFNVYPGEVEQVIASFDAVVDCAVIGVPHPDWGEEVKAVVELSPGKSLSADEIIARCKEALSSVKAPKSVDFIAELPRSTRGKVLKRVLREAYWKGREKRI